MSWLIFFLSSQFKLTNRINSPALLPQPPDIRSLYLQVLVHIFINWELLVNFRRKQAAVTFSQPLDSDGASIQTQNAGEKLPVRM